MSYLDDYKSRINAYGSTTQSKYEGYGRLSYNMFEQYSPNRYVININYDSENDYVVVIDTILHSETAYDGKVLYAQYDSVLKNGDFFEWKGFYWILVREELKSIDGYKKFFIRKCKQFLKFIDKNGNLQSYPVYVEDKLNETQPDYDKVIHLPEGTIFAHVQYNEITKEIVEDRRFLFGNRGVYSAFRVHGLNNFSDENIAKLTLYQDPIDNERDDLVNGIANAYIFNYTLDIIQDNFSQTIGYTSQLDYTLKLNGNEVTRDVVWASSDESIATIDQDGNIELLDIGNVTFTCTMSDNGNVSDSVSVEVTATPSGIVDVRFEPNKTTISSTEGAVVYDVRKYLDNIVQIDGFDFALSGADSSNYTYTLIDDNSFSVESLGFDYSLLKIIATSKIDSSVGEINIQLKNLF